MYRPGGLSGDESDSDFEGFAYEGNLSKHKRVVNQVETPVLSNNEQLIEAALNSDVELLETLVSKGADVNFKPVDNWSALIHVSSIGNKNTLSWLTSHGADVHLSHEKVTPLLALCNSLSRDEDQLLECLDILLEKGASPHDYDWFRVPAISKAVRRNHKKLVTRLINIGCDLNFADVDGWTPVFYAVDTGNIELVDLLKDCGAQLYNVDKKGRSLVELAASKDCKDIVDLLGGTRTDYDDDVSKKSLHVSSYRLMLMEFPHPHDKLSGFPSEVHQVLKSVGLECLTNIFTENGIHFGHCLNISEDRLQEIGLRFQFDRRRLLHAIKEFHEHPWSISAFGTNLANEQIDIFQITQSMATILRQVYVIRISVHCWNRENSKDVDEPEKREMLRLMLKSCQDLKRMSKAIHIFCRELNSEINPVSCDLITPESKPSRRWSSLLKPVFIGGLIAFCVIRLKR